MKQKDSALIQRADEISRLAAQAHIEQGLDPSDAISAHKDFLIDSDPFIDLVVAKTNHEIFSKKFHSSTDKREEFPVADAAKVKAAMSGTEKVAHPISPVWLDDVEPFHTMTHHKVAMGTDSRGRPLDDYGFPSVQEPRLETSSMFASRVGDTLQQAKLAAELIHEAEHEERVALAGAIESFKGGIKTAHDYGEDVFMYCQEVAGSVDVEKRAEAAAIANHCVDALLLEGAIKVATHKAYTEQVKTASIDMTPDGYQIIRGDDAVVFKLNTALGYDKRSRYGERREAGPGDDHYLGVIDYNIPYEVTEIVRPRQSSPSIGKIFGDGVID